MKCVNCGHAQVSGKFCGKCGTAMELTVTPTAATQQIATMESAPPQQPTTPAQPNEHIERMKQTSKMYVGYAKEFLKHPNRIFQVTDQQFINSLITIAIILLLSAYTVFIAVKSIYKNTIGGAAGIIDMFSGGLGSAILPKLEFFPMFSKAFMFLLLMLAISVGITFAITKFTKIHLQFKQLISIYGTLLLPVIGMVLFAFLAVLINKVFIGLGVLLLAFAVAVYVYPLRLLFTNFGSESKVEATHRGLIYFVGVSFVFYLIASHYVKGMLDKMGSLMELINPF